MTRYQLVLIAIAVILVVTLYFGAEISPNIKKKTTANTDQHQSPDTHSNISTSNIDWTYISENAKSHLISSDIQLLNNMQSAADGESNLEKKSLLIDNIVRFWISKDNDLMAAKNLEDIAIIDHNDTMWIQTGLAYQQAADQNTNPKLAQIIWQKTKEAFTKATQINDSNIDAKIYLANAIIASGESPMKGVGILLDVVRRDSTHVKAQLELGRFAIISQQFDKAIMRLEKVIQYDPQNADALFLLAEAYKGIGDKTKAKATFEKCKLLIHNDSLKTAIDQYILDIN